MKYEYVFDSGPRHQLNMIKDKKMSYKTQLKKVIIFNLKIGRLNKRSTATDISQNPLDQQVSSQKIYISPDIP